MRHATKRHHLFYGIVPAAIISAAALSFLLTDSQASEKPMDWPPLTMTYETHSTHSLSSSDGQSWVKIETEAHRLTYNSRDSWVLEIIEAEPVNTHVGVFSVIGSYQKLHDREYIAYDSVTGQTTTETLEAGVNLIPRGGLAPIPINALEDAYGIELSPVSTSSKVCFHDDCEENAEGLLLVDNGREFVYANDARGIPLKRGDFVIQEVLVQDERQEVQR